MSMIGRAFEQFKSLLQSGSPATVGIITSAIMLLCGFALTRLTKLLKLPNVTAYIVTGILIGPYCWDLVPRAVAENTSFLPDIALAFIAFSTGQFFRFSALKGNGLRVMVIDEFPMNEGGKVLYSRLQEIAEKD